MPKYRSSYRQKCKGLLDPNYKHPWHVHWEFTYKKREGTVEEIDKTDLETSRTNQIAIKKV